MERFRRIAHFLVALGAAATLSAVTSAQALPQQPKRETLDTIAQLKSDLVVQREEREAQVALANGFLKTAQDNLDRERSTRYKFSLRLFSILTSLVAAVCFCLGFGFGQQKLWLYGRKRKQLALRRRAA